MALFDALVDRVSAAVWNRHPRWAVEVGRHEYDGQVPALSGEALADGVERLGRLRSQLADLEGLDADQDLERAVLLSVAAREVFEVEVVRRPQRDPCWYLDPLDIGVYLERDYAPAGLRVERALAVLDQTEVVLDAARSGLGEEIPRAWCEWGIREARRTAARLGDLQGAPALRPAGEMVRRELLEAGEVASRAVEGFAGWLEERLAGAIGSWVMGRGVLEEWLATSESGSRPLEELAAIGRGLVAEDGEALAEAAAQAAPGVEVAEACRRVAAEPAADPLRLLGSAVEEARGFVEAAGLVALPAGGGLRVAPGLRLRPDVAGRLEVPGPYDDAATEAVLYLGPAGESASGPGPAALQDLAVTAAYPGRLVLLRRAAVAAGEAMRRFPSRGFQEGWALYAGDLMETAGYRAGDPAWRVARRRHALRADCRLVCSAGLSSGEMTLQQAEGVFAGQAFMAPAGARAEALRCSADPLCLTGALGRWELARLRGRWEAERPGVPCGAFHDTILSHGALPLGLLEGVVLG
jgi:hypothetical protein